MDTLNYFASLDIPVFEVWSCYFILLIVLCIWLIVNLEDATGTWWLRAEAPLFKMLFLSLIFATYMVIYVLICLYFYLPICYEYLAFFLSKLLFILFYFIFLFILSCPTRYLVSLNARVLIQSLAQVRVKGIQWWWVDGLKLKFKGDLLGCVKLSCRNHRRTRSREKDGGERICSDYYCYGKVDWGWK